MLGSLPWFEVVSRGCSVFIILVYLLLLLKYWMCAAFPSQQRSCGWRGLSVSGVFRLVFFFVMDKWLTAESIVPEVEQAVSHRLILGSGWGKVIWEKKNQAKKANRKLCTAWIISPNSLSSMSRGQFITVLSNSGLKKGCLKYNLLFGTDSYKDSVNVPLCVKLLSSGWQSCLSQLFL